MTSLPIARMVANVAYIVPSFLVVPANSPANSPKELVAIAKSSLGKLNFGSGGVGSSQQLFGVMLNAATGIDTGDVSYKGTAPDEAALVSAEIDYMVDPPTALPFVTAGGLKVLAVAAPKRSGALPNVPTLDEVRIPNVYTSTFYGCSARGTAQGDRRSTEQGDQCGHPITRNSGAHRQERRGDLHLVPGVQKVRARRDRSIP